MSTTVVYASGESGYIYCTDASVYLDAARGNSTLTTTKSLSTAYVGQQLNGGYLAYNSFLRWDTSAVGTDTVSNVDLEARSNGDFTDTDFTLETYAYDWGATLEDADFRDSDTGIPALGSIVASYDTSGGWSIASGYNNDLGALAAFNAAINGSGDTLVVVISQEHRNESAPTDYELVSIQGTGEAARLTITHAPGGHYVAPTDDITTTGWTVA